MTRKATLVLIARWSLLNILPCLPPSSHAFSLSAFLPSPPLPSRLISSFVSFLPPSPLRRLPHPNSNAHTNSWEVPSICSKDDNAIPKVGHASGRFHRSCPLRLESAQEKRVVFFTAQLVAENACQDTLDWNDSSVVTGERRSSSDRAGAGRWRGGVEWVARLKR